MKKIFSLFLLMATFSFQSFAQGPVDEFPDDPYGIQFQTGYSEGAIEAINLKVALGGDYMGTVDFIEWHAFDPDQVNNVGAIVSVSSPGLKIPVIIWEDVPNGILMFDPVAFDALVRIDQARDGSSYAEGYYTGFNDHFFSGPWI